MFEKVNPSHPDKIADRIAGAIVDLGYKLQENPKVACEVLIGHGNCHIIIETSVPYKKEDIEAIVNRIDDSKCNIDLQVVPQDTYLSNNQLDEIRCGDNGIFRAVKVNKEEQYLSDTVRQLYAQNPTDGKFIYDEKTSTFIACQSNIETQKLEEKLREHKYKKLIVNPLGDWTGGINVDTGATNRKLGSDMGRAVTGGGIHGKDVSKADVSVNIYLHELVQKGVEKELTAICAIGDTHIEINGMKISYKHVVKKALDYVQELGGFEKLAEWGLI